MPTAAATHAGHFPGHGEDTGLDLPDDLSPAVVRQLAALIGSRDRDAYAEALSRVGNCAKPIRLIGSSHTIDRSTGEIVGSYSSASEPLGVTHVRCGNPRASECPSCSRVYVGDMFHLIRAGVAGGKTVPETVADNPLVFATVTAPSFGHVHGRRDSGRGCLPVHAGGRGVCVHGRPRACLTAHADDDPILGLPVCGDCYDYASHVIWQWWAPDLWRRFTIALRRLAAHTLRVPATRLVEVATVQYAKVSECQARGVIHFHLLVRLDGPHTRDGFAPVPAAVDAGQLAGLVKQAVRFVRLTVPGVDTNDPDRVLAFGRQVDARPVKPTRRDDDPDRALTIGQVSGYLAKYATKSATDTPTTASPHQARIRVTVRDLANRADRLQPLGRR